MEGDARSLTGHAAPSLPAQKMRDRTSIYRQHAELVYAVAGPVTRNDPAASTGPEAPFDFSQQRKASPVEFLLYKTRKWLDTLPARVQPRALCGNYPRVANLIATMWVDAAGLRDYFDELLVDRRRGRRGFPPDVLSDLRDLRDHHAVLHPRATSNRGYDHRNK
jgi:hypothetical protein